MYLSHYNLSDRPFETMADPKFIWLGAKHAEALANLQYGLQENKGFLLLTGGVGTGKTYEEKIDHTKKQLRFASEEPIGPFSGQKNIEKSLKMNIDNENGLRPSCIIYFQNASRELSQR